ncbi:NAD-glutamate dehydrogenase domain-containing protein [Nocardia donostiensis]|uniref:Glutamate dehydrogenase n=1 Tax=Nocardia donostiensis TaxID=1538463 RepID=A0A1V2TDD8_9NOCA|nr:NAD-glutamate dehydrogenase domain-containing protein [Nocardia donostiensis]ONM47526.1 glutamate dehydrogenase [Nocardia donostiensis]OQS15131.1 glutamate dehydrogenase [Nocardia donostiensis]OQS24304.1 glutamate dehydrogenase [Nocardia donostiensis]
MNTVHTETDAMPTPNEIGDALALVFRSWDERLLADTDPGTRETLTELVSELPAAYKQDIAPEQARQDLRVLAGLTDGSIDVRIIADSSGPGTHRLSLYVGGSPASLSELMPLLQSLGAEVLDERPYPLVSPANLHCWIYVFTLRYPIAPVDDFDEFAVRFAAAVDALWKGAAEPDRLGELIARAGMQWREVAVLRAYAEYLRQAGFPYSSAYVADALCRYPAIAAALIECFTARFDPSTPSDDGGDAAAEKVSALIESVHGLDEDRIFRALLEVIRNTLRTNHFIAPEREALALKLDSRNIGELPEPRPRYEIFVYSPTVAGVHMRFGAVARGGLRWSDRREDFRTEVLGLVKAQAVKNAVIVPVGAKGGFVLRKPPAPTGHAEHDRAALRAAGIAGYRAFIRGLLDLTDNVDRTTGEVRPPLGVVRRDGDDPYLVVAADKGTASFSDIANEVAAGYDFWLGDAFASGGSVGYDHKAMGITARGAWESVKRRFRELGLDCDAADFTVAGIGDMSGDVFGNGMLCSAHIRLVAAFDHRHIFLDPDPDPERSYAERARLFALPRSSWADYDRALLSEGGGVWERTAKSVPISAQARRALGLDPDITELTPPELIRAILRAPVDLLWNGGIGTYVKAATETHADAGDKANDAVRVNGCELRARVVGEGGNLGLTQAARIEIARAGGRVGTDALDNSAGVDCSDHEVNIKILLDDLVGSGVLSPQARPRLLAEMTDEVAALVLADNISQNELLGTALADAPQLLGVHARQIAALEAAGELDRALEVLPDVKTIAARRRAGEGLTAPELATLTAHVKLDVKRALLAGELVDHDVFLPTLRAYFPRPLRDDYADAIDRHPLRREIVATALTNTVIDRGGITYAFRLAEEAGATPEDAVRAFSVVTAVFGLPGLWARIAAAPVPSEVADELVLVTRRLLDRASRWLLHRRPQPLAVGAEITRFRDRIAHTSTMLDGWLVGTDRTNLRERTRAIAERGAPEDLVRDVELALDRFGLLDVVEIAELADCDIAVAGELYFRLCERVGLVRLLNGVSALSKETRWDALARLSLRDELYDSVRALTSDVLAHAVPGDTTERMLADWEERNESRLRRARSALAEIDESGQRDLAALSVASRQLRRMAA